MKTTIFRSLPLAVAAALSLFLAPLVCAQNDNPTGAAGIFGPISTTGGSYSIYTANQFRIIPDITVAGAVGSYPLQWSRTTNSRQPSWGPFGSGAWRHSYQWSCTAPSGSTNLPNSYTVSYPDGRVVTFNGTGSAGTPYKASNIGIGDRFQATQGTNVDCYLLLADGGKVKFRQHASLESESRTPVWDFAIDFPTQIIDPNNLITTLTYDSVPRLTQVTEPAGRWLKIYYRTDSAFFGLIDHVDAGYGSATLTQTVTYAYGTFTYSTSSYKVLTGANYSDGTAATYAYQHSNVYPYTGIPLIWKCYDVRYPGPMKNIAYDFVQGGFYGQLSHEKYPKTDGTFTNVVTFAISGATRTETRGDGPQRSFTFGTPGQTGYSVPRPYFLGSYTDFKAQKTYFSYDANGWVSKSKDANLHETSFTRLALTGALSSVTFPAVTGESTATVNYGYEDSTTGYYLKSITDELGRATLYKHGNTTTMTTSEVDYLDGGVELFEYNGYNQVTSHTMVRNTAAGGSGGKETFTYDTDGRGLLMTYTPPTGTDGPTNYTYDVNDHLSTIKDGRGYTTTLYHNQIGQLTIIQHPTDKSLVGYAYNPDGTLALVNTQFGPDSSNPDDFAETDYFYDDYKRLTSVTTPPRFSADTTQRTTSFYYFDDGSAGTVSVPNDYTHTGAKPTRILMPSLHVNLSIPDANKRTDHTIIGYGTTEAATTYYTYDNVGNVATVKDPRNFTTTYFYDARDRLIGVDDPISNDRNTASPAHTVSYTYDIVSNKKSEQRANDQKITYDTYDAMNRLTKMTIPQSSSVNDVTQYTWTKAGKVATMLDPRGKLYTYDYDTLNRLKTTTYPADSGNVVRTETRTYDLAGNLWTFKNRAGNTQTFTYDTRERETNYTWSNGAPQPRTLIYDNASRIISCNTANTFINFVYYNDNLLKSQEEWGTGSYGDNTKRTITYDYNADGLRSKVTYPGIAAFTYAYTNRNQLQNMIWTGDNGHAVDYTYDKNGFMTNRSLQNGTSSVYTPDALNRVTHIGFNFTGATGSLDYAYDAIGRRTHVVRDGGPADQFGYDLNDQLTTFRRDGTLSGDYVTGGTLSTYYLDQAGNRTSVVTGSTTTTYGAANDLNQYTTVGGLTVTNGNNGNLANYNGWAYGYDSMNRITSASNGPTSATFFYDGLNRQVARVENGVTTYSVYDGWNVFAEYDAGGTQTNRWIYAGNDLIRSPNPVGHYYYPDASGSTRYLADNSGNLVEKYTYDVYGTPTVTTVSGGPYNVTHLFTGQRWYSTLGIYDLRNRAYMPSMGRFLQPDPIGFSGDAANLYRYCGNNPVNWSDPSGLGDRKGRVNRIVVTGTPVNAPSYRGSGPGFFGGPGGNAGNSGEPGGVFEGIEHKNGDFETTLPSDLNNPTGLIQRAPPLGGAFFPPGTFPGVSPGSASTLWSPAANSTPDYWGQIDPTVLAKYGKGFDRPGLQQLAKVTNGFGIGVSVVVAAPVVISLGAQAYAFSGIAFSSLASTPTGRTLIQNTYDFVSSAFIDGGAPANKWQTIGALYSLDKTYHDYYDGE